MKRLFFLSLVLLAAPWRPAFATWDVATPAGSEAKSLGDDRIRELKTDIQTSLQYEGDFPGSDTANPRFIWTPSTGTTANRPTGNARATGMLYINKSSNTIEQYSGSRWDPVATWIPSGSTLPFFQTSCPAGWTQVTGQNDKFLRVVSSAGGGIGGSNNVSTGLLHNHSTQAHHHTTPAHQHLMDYSTVGSLDLDTNQKIGTANSDSQLVYTLVAGGSTMRQMKSITAAGGDSITGDAQPDTNDASPTFKYIDMILCTAP